MTLALPSERNDATRSARPQRLTRAQRTAILKALADPKRFELLENIARAKCPLGCAAAHEALVPGDRGAECVDVKPGVLEALSAYLQSLSPTSCPNR